MLKRKIKILILITIIIAAIMLNFASAKPLALTGKVITIDAGHGGPSYTK